MMTTQALDLLKQYPQWVCWKYEERDGKPTKVPKNPNTGGNAASNNPATWGTYDEAILACKAANFDGIGFMLDPGAVKLVGVDLDYCLDNGTIKPWAKDIVTTLNSYTEITPSGEGLRVFLFGDLPPKGRKNGQVELYTSGRFLTVTGNHLDGTPTEIKDREAEILTVHRQIFGDPKETRPAQPAIPTNLDDQELIERARSAANGAKFSDLWAGKITGHPSASEADLALCEMLAFWTGGDANQIDRLFRASGLIRDKWDETRNSDGQTYGEMTISKALEVQTEFYSPPAEQTTGPPPPPEPTLDIPATLEELWPVYSLSEGLKLYEEAVDWLIYGLWERDSIGVTFGDGASGKTYLAINFCVALACGLPILSNQYPYLEPQKVLYFISEGRRHFFPRILAAINGAATTYNRPVEELRELVEQNLIIQIDVPQLYAENAKRSIKDYLKLWHYRGFPQVDFAVIDTLHRASVGGDENSEKDANIILENVREFVRETGGAVNIVHHSNKAGGYRGSSAYRNDVEAMLKVEGIARAPRKITIDKEKDAPPDGPIMGTEFEMQFYIDEATEKSYVCTFLTGSTTGKENAKDKAKPEIVKLAIEYPGMSMNQMAEMVTSAGRNKTFEAINELRVGNQLRLEKSGRSMLIYPV